MAAALSTGQIQQYREKGYIYGLPVFSPSELDEMNTGLDEILALLEPGESTKEIREWHEASRFLFDLCMHDRILDYVEPLIGPDFVMWASNFFIKQPRSPESVTWHQDAYYWPLEPRASCTVWLAFDDVDAGNGGMAALPGSHKHGILPHNRIKPDSSSDGKSSSVLGLECDVSQFDLATSEIVTMKAGEVSIHSDQLAHSSPGNPSRPTARRVDDPVFTDEREVRPDCKSTFQVLPRARHRRLCAQSEGRSAFRDVRASASTASECRRGR